MAQIVLPYPCSGYLACPTSSGFDFRGCCFDASCNLATEASRSQVIVLAQSDPSIRRRHRPRIQATRLRTRPLMDPPVLWVFVVYLLFVEQRRGSNLAVTVRQTQARRPSLTFIVYPLFVEQGRFKSGYNCETGTNAMTVLDIHNPQTVVGVGGCRT